MIHLDTSFMILALAPGSSEDRKLRQWLRRHESIGMNAVAWSEFLCGPLPHDLLELAARIVSDRAPFQDEEADLSARLFKDSGRRRGSFVDCMVAATAIRAGARLATSNATDFRRFATSGLSLAVD